LFALGIAQAPQAQLSLAQGIAQFLQHHQKSDHNAANMATARDIFALCTLGNKDNTVAENETETLVGRDLQKFLDMDGKYQLLPEGMIYKISECFWISLLNFVKFLNFCSRCSSP